MAANTPQETLDAFLEKFNANDVEGVLAYYESNAAFVDEPGKIVQGTDALRESMSKFFAMKPTLTLTKTETILAGDIGTNYAKWTMNRNRTGWRSRIHGGRFR